MEPICPSIAQRLSSDIISTLPQSITETILCLIPVEEAARTSMLSRDWRYKWTTIPKLVFSNSTMSDTTSEETNKRVRHELLYAIHQVLLMRQGPIHEFTLSMRNDIHCSEIDQIIHHLSRNHLVKKLKLVLDYSYSYKLPSSAFSLHQLTDLYLESVDLDLDLDHQPTFNGLSSLRTLCLIEGSISKKTLLHLLSNCPSITSFTLISDTGTIGAIELFSCIPAIEHLTTRGGCVPLLRVLDSVPKELQSSLIHLHYFCMKQMYFIYEEVLFLAVSIKCSPNLKKIRLELVPVDYEEDYRCFSILEDYSDLWLEHLNELEIYYLSNNEPEMEFVKFILARSPKLKKVWISISCVVKTDQERLEMVKVLLRAPRASPVEIIVE